jgi:thiamine transport system substrate-binding protein
LTVAVVLAATAAACGGDDSDNGTGGSKGGTGGTGNSGGTVVLMTHDSFAVSKPVLAAMERAVGAKVKILRAGDAGIALNKAVLTKDRPVADAFFGVDNTFLGRALDEDVFEPYEARGLDRVGAEFRAFDREHRVTPIDYGDICLNYDLDWFGHDGHPDAPRSLDDLVTPAYKNLTVAEDPSQSSPGLGFLLATIAKYGDDGWEHYWEQLRDNGVRVDNGWEEAYNSDFTVNGGKYPLVVSYASSPPADVVYADPPKDTPSIGTVLTSCFRQVEFAGVLRNAKHTDAARKVIDFMLTPQFQADVPLQMFVYPVREGTPLPKVFEDFGQLAPHPYSVPADEIARHRDEWTTTWRSIVER